MSTYSQKPRKLDTQAIGLDFGLAFSKFLTGKENLHYGLWEGGMEVCAGNVGAAQEAYTKKLFKLLPKKKSLRILDIGGGAGETAKKLVALGHSVEIVIPSAFLAERCRENAGPDALVHECGFEDFKSDNRFDVCLFSESFQYIPLDIALSKSIEYLATDGVVIIADCFRSAEAYKYATAEAKVGGGHALADFRTTFENLGLVMILEEDITQSVAPTVDVEQDFFNVIGLGTRRIDQGLADTHPFVRWVLHRLLAIFVNKKRRERLDLRLNARTRTAETFCRYNTYLMMKIKPGG